MDSEQIAGSAGAILYLTNVHCADCVRDMMDAVLLDRPGVLGTSYDSGDCTLRVTFDPATTDLEDIRRAVSDLGYGFAAEPQPPHADRRYPGWIVVLAVAVGVTAAILVVRMLLGV